MVGHYSKMQDRDELYRLYWIEKKSTSEIGKIYGVSFKRVSKWLKRLDIPTRAWSTKGMKFEGRKLTDKHKEQLRKWHTGRKLSPEHAKKVTKNLTKANKKRTLPEGSIVKSHSKYLQVKANGKWVYYHRHLMENKLGRELIKGEEVHHINCDASDNSIDNLVVLTRTEHLKLHNQMERVIEKLFKLGIAYFDGKDYQVKTPS